MYLVYLPNRLDSVQIHTQTRWLERLALQIAGNIIVTCTRGDKDNDVEEWMEFNSIGLLSEELGIGSEERFYTAESVMTFLTQAEFLYDLVVEAVGNSGWWFLKRPGQRSLVAKALTTVQKWMDDLLTEESDLQLIFRGNSAFHLNLTANNVQFLAGA